MTDDAELVEELDVMVPMRDGIRLRTDVFHPAGDGPWPTLVQRYPYSTRDGIGVMFGRMIARQGYAVVVQSCRGRYGSEGRFTPFHPDVDDSYDTVEWAAARPWSTGRIGMFGASYSGMTQWTAAISHAPHLVCIAPAVCTWDWTVGGWYFSPGVLALGLTISWNAQMTPHEAERSGVDAPIADFGEAARLHDNGGLAMPGGMDRIVALQAGATRELCDRRPLATIGEFADLAPWHAEMCEHVDPGDEYWTSISVAPRVGELDLPVLHIIGWYDYFAKGALQAYSGMVSGAATESARRAQRLLIGPWTHNGGAFRSDSGPSAGSFFDFSPSSPAMRFFAHHLRGESLDGAPVRLFTMGANEWRDEQEWPLARTTWTSMFLRGDSDGRGLSTGAPRDEEPDRYVYDPADPVRGSIAMGATFNDPVDLTAIAERADVLVYLTEPFAEPVEITGPVSAELWVSSSGVSSMFTAKLSEVTADGSAILLCQGVSRVDAAVAPGEVSLVAVDMSATSVVLAAGHRLRLDISSSEYPTYELATNTAERITTSAVTVPATQQVFHDAQHASRVVLPIIPN